MNPTPTLTTQGEAKVIIEPMLPVADEELVVEPLPLGVVVPLGSRSVTVFPDDRPIWPNSTR